MRNVIAPPICDGRLSPVGPDQPHRSVVAVAAGSLRGTTWDGGASTAGVRGFAAPAVGAPHLTTARCQRVSASAEHGTGSFTGAMAEFKTLDVSDWPVLSREAVGRETKIWLLQPGVERRWLFKPTHVTSSGRLQGDDWAEKVASELASLLGVSHARVELAKREGVLGCISRDVALPYWELQSGAVALNEVVDDFIVQDKARTGHTLENIAAVLRDRTCPSDALVPGSFNAFDLFSGYLLFDAWIANRDRHEENWAVLRPPPASLDRDTLSPSFDHASSLGFQLDDSYRVKIMSSERLTSWCEGGTATRFEVPEGDPATPTLVDLARRGLNLAQPGVREYWLGRLASVDDAYVADCVTSAARMSDPARRFVLELLRVNRGRLLA